MKVSPEKARDLLENADRYHDAYYRAETFGGPSLYFHQRALDTRQSPASLPHLEIRLRDPVFLGNAPHGYGRVQDAPF